MQRILKKVSGLLHDRKKRTAGLIILTLIALCVAVFGGLALLSDRQNNAYRVYLGDEYLCAVRDEEELSSACDSFLSELRCPAVSQKYGNDPCRLEEAYVSESELTSGTEAKALIVAHYADVIEYGCGIRIDGELFGAVSDQSVVETALSDLLSDTMLAFGGESAEICETVETQMGYYSRAIFIPDAELLSRFEGDSLPAPQAKSVGVTEESGENGEELSDFGVDSDEDGEEEPESGESLPLEEETTSVLDLSEEESEALFDSAPIHAAVTVRREYSETLPYEEQYVSLEGYYSDYWYTEQEGEEGEALVCDLVTYLCGREISRENLSKTVVTEPVPLIIEIGATERPDGFEAGVQSGTFSWPAPTLWTITSYWGDGRGHKGLDISGSGAWGEPIVASDAGYVCDVSYGWSGGYGNYVDIDHGNGYVTRYAHCSDLCVEIGEPVAKGEIIAYVGSTGDSSGPHLHFEVIRWGEKRDPYPYLFEGICIDRC